MRSWHVRVGLGVLLAVAGGVGVALATSGGYTPPSDPPEMSGYYRYKVLIDTDNNSGTGCPVWVSDTNFEGPVTGIEKIVAIYVNQGNFKNPTGGGKTLQREAGPQVAGIYIQGCTSTDEGFTVDPEKVSDGGWSVGLNLGTAFDFNSDTYNADVVEGFVPRALLGATGPLRLYYWASTPVAASDVLATEDDSEDGRAIILNQDDEAGIPTLAGWGRLAFAAALGLLTVWAFRRRLSPGTLAALFMAVALGTAAVAWATTITMDGNPADWEGSRAVVATDDLCDQTHTGEPSEDLLAAYATVDGTNAYFRVDVTDVEGIVYPCAPIG
jgi:hypothetical protein